MTSVAIESEAKPDINPTIPEFYGNGKAERFAWLHQNATVFRCENLPNFARPFWLLSNWEDIRKVSRNTDLFTTTDGIHISDALVTSSEIDGMPDDPRLPVGMKSTNVYGKVEHTRIRGAVNHNFVPARVLQLEPMVLRIVTECLDALPVGETFDFMKMVGHRVPLLFITELLGVGTERSADFDRWGHAIQSSFEPGAKGNWAAIIEMFDFLESEIEKRIAQPRDDLISDLVAASKGGEVLSREEIIGWCWILLIGGLETTEYLLGGGLLALLQNPVERDKLTADPALCANAVHEMLRYVTPVRYMARTATADTEIRGKPIAKGELVMMNYAVASRDPAKFQNPEKFDISREPGDTLAFGIGAHNCIGAPMARLEGKIVFEQLMRRYPALELAGEPSYFPSTIVNGIVSLPVIIPA